MMIWFNIKKTEKKLVENDFSDEEGFKYLLAFSILGVFSIFGSISVNFISFIRLFVNIAITIWGSYSIFKANASGDGKDFFKRYFILSWVIGFRLFLFQLIVIVFSIIIFFIISNGSLASDLNSLIGSFVSMIISSLFMLIYFLLLTNSFKRVSTKVDK